MSPKILHLASSFFPESTGATIRIYNLISRQPHEILLYTPDYSHDHTTIPAHDESYANIRVKRIHLSTKPDLLDALPYVSYVNRIRRIIKTADSACCGESFDIAHGHNPLGFGLAAQHISDRFKKPFIYESHGLNVDTYCTRISRLNPIFYPGLAYVYYNEARLIKHSDHVIALSNMLKRRIVRLFKVPEDKVTVVPNGIDINMFKPKPEYNDRSRQLKCDLNARGKIVMYAGYLDYINGIHNIAYIIPGVIKAIPDVVFVFIGKGPDEGIVRSMAEKYPNNVKLIGMIPYELMPAYYAMCDVFLIPRPSTMSAEIIVPLKLIEAMAMGKVILGSNVKGISEVIQDGENGFLYKKDDMGSFETTLKGILQKDDFLIGMNARRSIMADYSWDASAILLDQLYTDIYERIVD